MNTNAFATQIAHTGKPVALSGSNTALLGNSGAGLMNGLAFWEIILGTVDGEEKKANIITPEFSLDTSTNSKSTIKKEAADLSLLQIALMGQNVDKTLEEQLSELSIEKLVQNPENRIAQLTKLIDHLTNGLPQQADGETTNGIEDLLSRLTQRLEKLEASLDAFRTGDFSSEDAPFKLLIATGLNPAQITRITQRIEEVETKLGRELTVDDLIAGVGNIIPVTGNNEDKELSVPDALGLLINKAQDSSAQEKKPLSFEDIATEDATTANEEIANIPGVATQLQATETKAIKPGITKHYDIQALLNIIASNKIAPAGTDLSGLKPGVNSNTAVMPEFAPTLRAEGNLNNTEFRTLFGGNAIKAKGNAEIVLAKLSMADKTPAVAVPKLTELSSALGNFNLPSDWNMSWDSLSQNLGFDIHTGTPFTMTGHMAHATTSSQMAGQSHPATQMVAAQITKAAQNGEARTITLQLDPPELGRVEIRMEFDANKKMKASIIAEKPETFLMLQRDSIALEKTLQNAGLDTSADSINYQLANESFTFGQDNHNNGNHKTGMENAKNSTEEPITDIIETTLTWNVDPETGYTRYNIVA